MGRVEVLYVERSMYEGADPDCPWPRLARRTTHRSWLTADFARRFRTGYVGPGWSSYTTTAVIKAGTPWSRDTANNVPIVDDPWYADRLEDWVWRPLYWLRKRWDGLRYGLDRDRKF